MSSIIGNSLPGNYKVNPFNTSLARNLLAYIPCYVYWKDNNFVYQGCNELFAKAAGLDSPYQIVGKTDFDLVWGASEANLFQQSDREVMSGQYKINFIEPQYQADGVTKTVLASKVPYFDEKGNIAGILGIYVDITEQQRIKKLKEEHLLAILNEQEKFTKLAGQVAHDIASPTAALSMLVESCNEIPEEIRLLLRQTAARINDTAHNLLEKYKNKSTAVPFHDEQKEILLASLSVLQILAEKRLQYANLCTGLEYTASAKANFSFVLMQPSAFKRMLSNIINNAFDALEGRTGKVIVALDASDDLVCITIEDNGKGMSSKLVDKIMQGIGVTEGKKDGHGIGLTQVYETLQHNQGMLDIESIPDQGSKVKLSFPRASAPLWIAEKIELKPGDTIVILDDDHSIHKAWRARFEPFVSADLIKIIHFKLGIKALEFIHSLSATEKDKLFLLTDYELLKQELNGLDVVAQSGIERSMLVTSYYEVTNIRELAAQVGAKILPKQLASEVPIIIDSGLDRRC